MTPETLEALKASIAKWDRNAVAETPYAYTVGCEHCALCIRFLGPDLDGSCDGCPVDEATGDSCSGSPYDEAYYERKAWNRDETSDTLAQRAKAAARAEVAFLKSLLPPEEQVP